MPIFYMQWHTVNSEWQATPIYECYEGDPEWQATGDCKSLLLKFYWRYIDAKILDQVLVGKGREIIGKHYRIDQWEHR